MRPRNLVKVAVIGLLAALLLVMPLVAACAKPAPAPAPTPAPAPAPAPAPKPAPAPAPAPPKVEKPKEVKIGRCTDLTGPYASICPNILAGFTDYAEFRNKHKNGIDGVPVKALWTDVKQDAAKVVTAYKRFKSEGCLVVSAASSGQTFAMKKLLEEDRIPCVTQAMNLSLYMPASDVLWANNISNPGETLTQLIWFDTEKWDRAKMGRAWRIGFLIMDIAYTKGALPQMYKYCDDNGIEMVGTEITPATTLDFSTNIKRLVDAGADVIVVSQCGAAAGIVLKQMLELGVLGPIDETIATEGKIVPMLNDCAFYISSMLAAPEAAQYAYGETPWGSWWEMEEYPGIAERNAWMQEKYGHIWHSGEEDGGSYNAGWNCARVACDAIERAVKAVGWDKLDSEAVIQKGLKGLKITENLMSCDLSYADYEGDRIGVEVARPASWDSSRTDRSAVGECVKVDQKYYVTKYTPKKPHPGMFVE